METPPDHGPILGEKVSQGVTIRAITHESLLPPRAFIPTPGIEWRSVDDLWLNIILNEKEALVSFCSTGGRADHRSFYGKYSTFFNWAKELFNYYWDMGKRIDVVRIAKSEK